MIVKSRNWMAWCPRAIRPMAPAGRARAGSTFAPCAGSTRFWSNVRTPFQSTVTRNLAASTRTWFHSPMGLFGTFSGLGNWNRPPDVYCLPSGRPWTSADCSSAAMSYNR